MAAWRDDRQTNECPLLAGCLDGQAGWLAGIAIEVEFEVASRWAINAIIAIIINARTSEAVAVAVAVAKGNRDPGSRILVVAATTLALAQVRRCRCCFYYCYGPITVSAINFPFSSSTTLITNATLLLLLVLLLWRIFKELDGWLVGCLFANQSATISFSQGQGLIKMRQISAISAFNFHP